MSEKRYTLSEILIVLAIIGILSVITIPVFINAQKELREQEKRLENPATLLDNIQEGE